MMTTAVVSVRDGAGNLQNCRVMLDNASSSNFVTESCVQRLKLLKKKTSITIEGLGQSSVGFAKSKVELKFCPHFNKSYWFFAEAFVIPRVSSKVPQFPVDSLKWTHLQGLTLADPNFNIPANIDILVGAEHYYELLGVDKRQLTPTEPIAFNSDLGWLIGGGKSQSTSTTQLYHTKKFQSPQDSMNGDESSLEHMLKKFWELEACPVMKLLSSEEELCEKHFLQTYTRDATGRFIVKYPFKTPRMQLGESLNIATRRFRSVEKRLAANADYHIEYLKFMRDYEALGHMVQVDPPDSTSKFRCYLPHHFVLKESSTTTKFRVVFDASAKTTNGFSLNDTMMVGPSIQDSIASLIMRFRKHKIAITADIEKMYRQILMDPEDQEFQHIVWRESPDHQLKHYKLLTITYGTAAGPYLATRVLHMLAQLEQCNFPVAARVLKEDFYMDDCMSGASSDAEAIELQRQLIELLDKGNLSIRKFTSNSERALTSLPEKLRETKSLLLDKEAGVKALGIFWNPSGDYFGFKTDISKKDPGKLTKRNLLSEISKLFDPIGWLAPILIKAKILMQSIWKEELGWDELVPDNITKKWEIIKSELLLLSNLKIPRRQKCSERPSQSTYLAGFSDASEEAYCAAVYLCTYDSNGDNFVSLITSKTRVAPIKNESLPRLELCGALLLAELIPSVVESLKTKIDGTIGFTDSTLTLGWIKSQPYKFKTFIANRISKIQEIVSGDKWGFVKGVENPSDLGTRGISVNDLIHHPLWWNGAPWLIKEAPKPRLPPEFIPVADSTLAELKPVVCLRTGTSKLSIHLFDKFSTLTKLKRVTAFMLRFLNNVRASIRQKKSGTDNSMNMDPWLNTKELHSSLLKLISLAQEQEFMADINCLRKGTPLPRNSKILSLNPFLDPLNILRVGGRLRHAKISLSQKHPILLPQHHVLTKLIINQAHLANLHAGPQTLLSFLQQKYWILRGKDAVRGFIRRCITCTRHRADTLQQVMADLPSFRVNPSFPFQQCGIDYAGPYLIRSLMKRCKTTLKAYLAIFVCCATRAIHIEVVSDASTDAFLAALRRFISRRGKPSDMYSDNGTNFVGANNEIKEFLQLINSNNHNQDVSDILSLEGINWHFNPPAAPHHGGLWEAGVKSTKYHLKRVMGLNRLTFEEMSTLTAQIEAILNSRPLTPESCDPSDLRALTPGHFLIGQPLTTIPDPDLISIPTNRLIRWQLIQQMLQQFWKRWSAEYITRLQQRPKWMQPMESIQVGAMVIVKDDTLPPLFWKLGRVVDVHPGKDDKVRTVTVKTVTGEYKRPIVKLCLLPVDDQATQSDESTAHATMPKMAA